MTPRDPSLMSEAERRREIAALLADGYRRFLLAPENQLAASRAPEASCEPNG